ncbi:hypothetical protein ACFSB1_13945 [Halopseudomonas phragmitis]|uniref:Uncharacterized protein n=2 Tax=Pseudomonadaceae TaxID=135621 RepID=A0A1V0B4R0_9GAMM|nr:MULTISPECIES: hypothetical protein [Pseudomonadaceae]AQZ94926.1 hypothetical protein BVH74_09275 [Halopseudomonas phragmitis]RHW23085.1 hypothetical protein C2846_01395 [Pseudomonas jilinensis]
MIAISYLLLTLFLAGLSLWLWPRRVGRHTGARGALNAGLVALLLAALSSLLLTLGQWGASGTAMADAQRIFGLAAQHLSLPLLGLVSVYLARGLRWKPMIWGQVILGLMACFELSRYLGWQPGYHWLVNLLGAAGLLASAVLYLGRDKRIAGLCLIAPVSLIAPALLSQQLPLTALLSAEASASWLLPGFVAAALAVGLLAEQAHNSDNACPSNDSTTAPR